MLSNLSQSRLLEYLPAIYQNEQFVGQFLLAFEEILLGAGDTTTSELLQKILLESGDTSQFGLEEIVANIALYFDPQQTPAEFVPWLASWTALSLRADLPLEQQRKFIANIISLYQRRGTAENLKELLKIFTVGEPTITEAGAEFQIGVNSQIGTDTYIGGGPPHFFNIKILLPRLAEELRQRQLEIARSLIDLEKPAHTYYQLEDASPSLKIGEFSTIGVDTLIGVIPQTESSL